MTMTEAFARNNICIDFASEVLYGSDQASLTYPRRFATVEFPLIGTEGLIQIADRIRKEQGYLPTHPMDEAAADACDSEAWYNFYTGISTFTENRMGSCIEFVVVNARAADNEKLYVIDLSEEEKLAVYNRLDEQCREHLGKSCEELLQEARCEMNSAGVRRTAARPHAHDGTSDAHDETSEEDTR